MILCITACTDVRHPPAVLLPEAPQSGGPSLQQLTAVPRQGTAAEYHPSEGWAVQPHHLDSDQLWARIREEARVDAVRAIKHCWLHVVIVKACAR